MSRRQSIKFLLLVVVFASLIIIAPEETTAREGGEPTLNVKTRAGEDTGTMGPIEEPDPDTARARMLLVHARNQRRLEAADSTASSAVAESMDIDVDGDGVDDIAVVVDNGRIIVPERPPNPLDLEAGMQIRYTPVESDTFLVELETGQGLDPTLGDDLQLGDDDFAEVPLDTPFSFLGVTYEEVFVGSDGHVTLGDGDGASTIRDAVRHILGPPRLSALLTDLNPDCAGAVHADVRADRVVVTWNEVIHFERGDADGCGPDVPTNTFQATLHASGTIEFTYGELDTDLIGHPGVNREGVTGIAEGNAEGPLNEIDMTEDLPVELEAGAIFEEYSPGSPEELDLVQLAREFYKTHEDKYDYLVTFTDFAITQGGALASSTFFKNQTLGLGLPRFDGSALAGSDGELENIVWMNNIYLWVGNSAEDYINPNVHKFDILPTAVTPTTAPYERFGMMDITGEGNSNGYTHHGRALLHQNPHTEGAADQGALRYDLNSPMSIMFQEAGHRWEAFPAFVHPTKGIGPDSFDLLGRSFAHWSTFFNTRVPDSPFTAEDGFPRYSGMEGNALIELDVNEDGLIVDKNNPGRIIDDPEGKLTEAFSSCEAQGKGLFLTEPEELVDGATELDQYLMGVRTAEEVSPFWYVDEPSSPLDGRSLDEPIPNDFFRGTTFNVDDIGFCGVRVDLTVEDITNFGKILGVPGNGPRVPAIGDENDVGPVEACLAENLGDDELGPCADVKTMAWVLVVRDGPPNSEAHMPAIEQLNEFREAWQAYVNGPALGNRNADGVVRPPHDTDFIPKFDTSLEPEIH